MPLIMLVGIPCSGKSTRCKELEKFFLEKQKQVKIVSDDIELVDKNKSYADSTQEKATRGKIKAAVERAITKDTVVIADSLNYIKGFRYELYCIAKSWRTPSCVVYCDTPLDMARDWNLKRAKSSPNDLSFDDTLLTQIASRMEIPNSQKRWEDPLFTVKPTDPTPFNQIFDAFYSSKKITRPNMSTLPQKLSDANLLYELDKITNEIINFLMENKTTLMPGDKITIPKSEEKFVVPQRITLPELRKLRSQYVKITQMHPPSSAAEIAKLFVVFLNNNLSS